MITQQFTWHH